MDRQTPHDQPRYALAFYLNLHPVQPAMVGLTMRYEREDDLWVGVCEELGTSTYDADLETVMHELGELVLHELNTLEADGERENMFGRCGIELLSVPANIRSWVYDSESPTTQAQESLPGKRSGFWAPQDNLAPALASAHL